MSVRAVATLDRNVTARSPLTKLLHFAVAACVVHQLVISQIMQPPTATAAGDLAWQAHRAVGLASLGLLLAFWVWVLFRRGEASVDRLLPWFSAKLRGALLRDIGDHLRVLRLRRLPPPGDRPLAAAVHGLGLLTASAMALTGAAALLPGLPPSLLDADLSMHSAVANLMWAYLVGHATLALLHEAAGHRLLRGMFLPSVTGGAEEDT